MVESKKRVNQSLVKPKKPLKQVKLSKIAKTTKTTKNVKKEQQPIIEQEEEEKEEEEVEEENKENKGFEEEQDKITFNNEEEEEEEEDDEEKEDKDNFEINENEENEEGEQKEIRVNRSRTNEQLLCDRFIKTMATTFAQQLKGKNSHSTALRGLYFESINKVKHETIRELLFKPHSWHKFFKIVRAILKKKDNDIEDIEIKETVDDDDDDDNEEEEDSDDDNNGEDELDQEEISNIIFKNLLEYEVISGRESLIQQLKDSQPKELQHLYKQSISLNQSNKYSIIVNSFFSTSKLSPSQLLDKFIMYSLTLDNVKTEIIDILNSIIDLSDINDKESNSSIYKSLRQFLSISILDNLKNNSTSNNSSIDNDVTMIKSYVKLATNLFKFSLLNSSNSSIQFIESDYSAIKLLLGKSITYLPKLVSMMTCFDFSQDQFIQQSSIKNNNNNNNNNNNISIFLNQFIQESKLSSPPTNSISYLKSRILCERGILVLTKLKDPLLTKLKISSATLPIPQSLLNFFKEKQGQSLLVKTHKSMDDNQAIRLLKLNNLLEILGKIEEIESQQDNQENQDNDYIEDHFIINKDGNADEENQENNTDENDEENGDEQIEEQIDSMDGTKSLLDFLDEDDLKSDDE
ncbi:hypothetical protein RB653_005073 [Dictyostelium firmibasis]|uniref:Uncharacterized protein n=1 Tax=Dictyostelium firmibasis TaxID=79012 RepID=A0AAN7Z0P6_9MYCE